MDDIVVFLRARYDDRERAARFVLSDYAQHEASWTVPSTGVVVIGEGGIADETILTGDGPLAEFIAANDPKSVLFDVAAKRQILKLHRPYSVTTANDGLNWRYTRCAGCEPIDRELGPNESYWPCPNLRLLALPFAGHPQYREEWRP